MQKIIPNLWFQNNAEEAVEFYTTIFNNSSINEVSHYDAASAEASGMPEGSVLTIGFTLDGYELLALNGGPAFSFTPAISFTLPINTEKEVDRIWEELGEGGKALMELDKYPFSDKYGWLEDKYGVSWQLIQSDNPEPIKIVPSFLFAGKLKGKAEEAMKLYTSLFKNSTINQIARYEDSMGDQPVQAELVGKVAHAVFTLDGQEFIAMDSGDEHKFTFSEAISLIVNCDTQEEVDHFWASLSADPEAEMCGWLKDKFGVSWQIVPTILNELLSDPNKEKASRAMKAMLEMKKLNIAGLEQAFEGE